MSDTRGGGGPPQPAQGGRCLLPALETAEEGAFRRAAWRRRQPASGSPGGAPAEPRPVRRAPHSPALQPEGAYETDHRVHQRQRSWLDGFLEAFNNFIEI